MLGFIGVRWQVSSTTSIGVYTKTSDAFTILGVTAFQRADSSTCKNCAINSHPK